MCFSCIFFFVFGKKNPQVKLNLSVFTQISYAEKNEKVTPFYVHCSVFLCWILLKENLCALQPLAIGDPTEVHCPQVCL